MNPLSFISLRQEIASLGVAVLMTMAVLASLGSLATGYHADAALAQANATDVVAVQQVVVTARRHATT